MTHSQKIPLEKCQISLSLSLLLDNFKAEFFAFFNEKDIQKWFEVFKGGQQNFGMIEGLFQMIHINKGFDIFLVHMPMNYLFRIISGVSLIMILVFSLRQGT
jgi:hypothetical protein